MPRLDSVPSDLLGEIAKFLPAKDLLRFEATNRLSHQCCVPIWAQKFNKLPPVTTNFAVGLVTPQVYLDRITQSPNYTNHFKVAYFYGKCFNKLMQMEFPNGLSYSPLWYSPYGRKLMSIYKHTNHLQFYCYPLVQFSKNSVTCKLHFHEDEVEKLFSDEKDYNWGETVAKAKRIGLWITAPLWIWFVPLINIYVGLTWQGD